MKYVTDHIFATLELPPTEVDVALVSINEDGTPGPLNTYVASILGYDVPRDIPHHVDLSAGTVRKQKEGLIPIIYVVTIGQGNTSRLLQTNLRRALKDEHNFLMGKRVWLPLMGTGNGGLSFDESWDITYHELERFQKEFGYGTDFYVSIPEAGKDLYDNLINWERVSGDQENIQFNNLNNAEAFVKSLSANFYVVGTIWNEDGEQLTRFIEQNIWETGYEDEYANIINSITNDDIIIAKSSFQANGISYLRIKAVGIVTNNPKNGTTIAVDWRVRNIIIDIEGLGKFRKTISKINAIDASKIFNELDEPLWERLSTKKTYQIKKSNTLPGLLSDTDKGDDLLDIKNDINAFAKVMSAKSFTPPLAIALFGKWGSGKSFFMNKLKTQVEVLSQIKSNKIYCNGVAQIHFNAWSYMDSNLWASFVTKIFEGLNEYISENSESEEKKYIEAKLRNELSVIKDDVQKLEQKKKAVTKQIHELNNKKSRLQKSIKQKIISLRKKTTWTIIKKVDTQFNAAEKIKTALLDNKSYNETNAIVKDLLPTEYWKDPKAAYNKIKSTSTFLRVFFHKKNFWKNAAWLSVILLIIYLFHILLWNTEWKLRFIDFTIPQTFFALILIIKTLAFRAKKVYNELYPVITEFWRIKENYETEVRKEISEFEQEEKAIQLELEKNKEELLITTQNIQQAEVLKVDVEYRIQNALSSEALYNFIGKRSNSEEYRKHLGIISTIRKDFEILNDLFVGHNSEIEKQIESEEFKNKFKKPLERIILYIDDLDRCPEENVVQVLEAVNLLMAFPLFIVVVGVDQRWVKNALIKKHHLQFTGSIDGIENTAFEIIDPSNYLEKIFQIPFCLKDASQESIKGMIRSLSMPSVVVTQPTDSSNIEVTILNQTPNDANNIEIPIVKLLSQGSLGKTVLSPKLDTANDHDAETLILSEIEVSFLEELSMIVGNNPRAIKRFVNTFRIIKAHEEFNYESRNNDSELLAVIFLLAISIGRYKKLEKSLSNYASISMSDAHTLLHYLQYRYIDENPKEEIFITELKDTLRMDLSLISIKNELQDVPLNYIDKHSDFIRRFTFNY